ncbi:MAG: phosphatidylserine/phosphatidylglycerophosphate/cardiolipin synthase family protein [Bdellovibrionaceae bacterium]|nr:phosphatidylserine/phosphatidylglycerophosphate/cardiolipin synthase family protein [Pseudobdellovibrionaceae bacterium]
MKYGKANFFSILKEKVEKGFEFSLIRPGIAKQADEMTMFMNDHIQQNLKNKDLLGAGVCFVGKCLGKIFVNSSVRSGFRSLLENYGNKINVYDFPRYSHSKIYIYDDSKAFIGSVNMDDHSLDNNYEIGFGCDDPRLLNQLRTLWAEDLTYTKQVLPMNTEAEAQK